jgi:16S rRNA (guanine527-N7)-methyltransferase
MTLERLGSGWQPLVHRALLVLGAEPLARSENVAAMCELCDQVATWNARINLTSAQSPEQLVDLYVADAAVMAVHGLPGATSWVDVGSGAGAPGLSLALLSPDLSVTLVEPRAKRVAFLRTVGFSLVGDRARVVRGRSSELPDGAWEIAVSRATLPPAEWLAEGTRLARRGVWILLGQAQAPSRPGWRLAADVSYQWPLTGAVRRALCFAPE